MEIKTLTKEQAKNLAEQGGGYSFDRTLREIMGKDNFKNPLDSFDYLPFLCELATKQTILCFKSSCDLLNLTTMVNLHYGTLCYKAYHKEIEGLKTNEEYAVEWGQCLEALVKRADLKMIVMYLQKQHQVFIRNLLLLKIELRPKNLQIYTTKV